MSAERELRQALRDLGLPDRLAFVDVHARAIEALARAYREQGPERMRETADRVITLVGRLVEER